MADKNVYIENALKYLQRNQLDKAVREYYRALEVDPRDVRLRHKLGELLARQGVRVEALKQLGMVAEAYAKEGFYLKAVAVYKQMVKIKPDLFDVHLQLGDLYAQLTLPLEAMEHYRLVADNYDANGTNKDCIDVYQRITKLDATDLHSKQKLAEYYVREEKLDDAVGIYQAVASALSDAGRTDELCRIYERLIQLVPGNLSYYKTIARMYLDQNDARRALGKLQVCFKVEPGDEETLSMLGDTFVAIDQASKALAVYKELARIYDYKGLSDRVRDVYERVRRVDPADVDALAALGLDRAAESSRGQSFSRDTIGSGPLAGATVVVESGPGPASTGRLPASSGGGAPPVQAPAPDTGGGAGGARAVLGRLQELSARRPSAVAESPSPRGAGRSFGEGAGPASSGGSEAAHAVPALSSNERLREIPAQVSKLMTEAEVYLKYNLAEKARSHLQAILELAPSCYPAREKRRDLLIKLGSAQEAAAESQRMSMLASNLGDFAQARLDLESAISLDPSNQGYQHALHALSMMATAAPQGAPPFYVASSAAQVLIEEFEDESLDDEGGPAEESVYEFVDDSALESLSQLSMSAISPLSPAPGSSHPAGAVPPLSSPPRAVSLSQPAPSQDSIFSSTELIDDGDGFPSLFLEPFGLDEASPEPASADVLAEADVPAWISTAIGAPAPVRTESSAQNHRSPAPALSPAGPGPAPGVRPARTELSVGDLVMDLFSSAGGHDLVEDSESGLDLVQELQAELELSADERRTPEAKDHTTRSLELARAYFEMHLYTEAFKELDQIQADGPEMVEVLRWRGRCFHALGDYSEAVRAYQTVLNRNDLTETQELEALFELSLTYEAQEDLELAMELFEEIAGLNPHFRRAEVQGWLAELTARLKPSRVSAAQ